MGQDRASQRVGVARAQSRPSLRTTAGAGLAALLGLFAVTGARGETLSLDYLVGWGHLTIAEAEVSYSQTESRYHLVGDGRTRGVLDVFVSSPRLAAWLVERFGTAHWPTFNIADSAIVSGACLLVLTLLRPPASAEPASFAGER